MTSGEVSRDTERATNHDMHHEENHATDRETYAVIMAGGAGTRFWPRSRRLRPKQVLSIASDVPLVRAAIDRIPADIPADHVFVITGADQRESLLEATKLPGAQVIGEPEGRDTAPCIALAAGLIDARSPGATMLVMPADHVIAPATAFHADVTRAVAAARGTEALVTFGIPPRHPAGGYGHIKTGEEVSSGVRRVVRFHEKPGTEGARKLMDEGGWLWNAGIFCWTTTAVLSEMERQQPDLAKGARAITTAAKSGDLAPALAEVYPTLTATSIDYGIMEGAQNRLVVETTFDWDDVGSFAALARHHDQDGDGNTCLGDTMVIDAKNCIVDNTEHDGLLAVLGVEDVVVVRTADATLVVAADRVEEIKRIVGQLRETGREDRL